MDRPSLRYFWFKFLITLCTSFDFCSGASSAYYWLCRYGRCMCWIEARTVSNHAPGLKILLFCRCGKCGVDVKGRARKSALQQSLVDLILPKYRTRYGIIHRPKLKYNIHEDRFANPWPVQLNIPWYRSFCKTRIALKSFGFLTRSSKRIGRYYAAN